MTLRLLMLLWFMLSALSLAASAWLIACSWPAPARGFAPAPTGWRRPGSGARAQPPDTRLLPAPTAQARERRSDEGIRIAVCEELP